ncbi:hypothetical protein PIROE2DRAFT_36085, partial [Piromyces sp. E2]
LITSYQLIVTDEKYFQKIKWQYMILDEAQAIKSSNSARWKTLLGFNCRNRCLLTGTPIQNSMQELWALLHFIMPTLFDSHEEFSEWFSKDIESHAENKGTLNQHQLKRLHMILKPFMLRRIKRDVEHELGEKIELEVKCQLTPRQKRMYQGVKEKISVSELLDRMTSLNDKESIDSLMNLVMQFRKVCNHPELFERAPVISPFWFDKNVIDQQLPVGKEGDHEFNVIYSPQHPIQYHIPKLIYRSGLVQSPRSNCFVDNGTKRRVLDHLFNIYAPEYINETLQITQDDESPSPFDNSLFILPPKYLKQNQSNDTTFSPNSYYLGRNYGRIHDAFKNMTEVYKTFKSTHILMREHLCYMPMTLAPPIEVQCSDRGFVHENLDILFEPRIKHLLTEIELCRIINDELDTPGLIGKPPTSQGFTNIWIPPVDKLIYDSGKLTQLDHLLKKLKDEGHRVLIFFQMVKMIDIIEEYLTYRKYTYLRLDGSTSITERNNMVSDWQTRSDLFIFLLSTRAGGLGINLTAADTVIFYDNDWNPTVDQQAMDRCHRLGQTKQVTVYRLITAGTVEERILRRAKQKDQIQKVVISG